MRTVILALLWALVAGPLQAGAWPRDKGSWFVSLGYEATTLRSSITQEALAVDPSPELYGYGTLYAEYGLTERLTLGVDAGRDDGPATWTGVAFARWALGSQDWAHRFAIQGGLGQRRYIEPGPFALREYSYSEPIGRLGLAWGHGLETRFGNGWLGLEGSVEHRMNTADQVFKLDAVAGLRRSESVALLLQVQSGDYPKGNPYVKILPGVVTKLWRNLSLETSLIAGVVADDRIGFRTAIWADF